MMSQGFLFVLIVAALIASVQCGFISAQNDDALYMRGFPSYGTTGTYKGARLSYYRFVNGHPTSPVIFKFADIASRNYTVLSYNFSDVGRISPRKSGASHTIQVTYPDGTVIASASVNFPENRFFTCLLTGQGAGYIFTCPSGLNVPLSTVQTQAGQIINLYNVNPAYVYDVYIFSRNCPLATNLGQGDGQTFAFAPSGTQNFTFQERSGGISPSFLITVDPAYFSAYLVYGPDRSRIAFSGKSIQADTTTLTSCNNPATQTSLGGSTTSPPGTTNGGTSTSTTGTTTSQTPTSQTPTSQTPQTTTGTTTTSQATTGTTTSTTTTTTTTTTSTTTSGTPTSQTPQTTTGTTTSQTPTSQTPTSQTPQTTTGTTTGTTTSQTPTSLTSDTDPSTSSTTQTPSQSSSTTSSSTATQTATSSATQTATSQSATASQTATQSTTQSLTATQTATQTASSAMTAMVSIVATFAALVLVF